MKVRCQIGPLRTILLISEVGRRQRVPISPSVSAMSMEWRPLLHGMGFDQISRPIQYRHRERHVIALSQAVQASTTSTRAALEKPFCSGNLAGQMPV